MGKKQQKITVQAFVHINNKLVDVDTLNEQQREYIGELLNYKAVSAVYRGRAEVILPDLPKKEEVFAEYYQNQYI